MHLTRYHGMKQLSAWATEPAPRATRERLLARWTAHKFKCFAAQSVEKTSEAIVAMKKIRRGKNKKNGNGFDPARTNGFLTTQGLTPCVTCRRGHPDQCRFRKLRAFRLSAGVVSDISFPDSEQDLPIHYPVSWNMRLDQAHITEMKCRLAVVLLPIMQAELAHLGEHPIHRSMDMEVRINCDLCTTSIFSSSWQCRKCGRDLCTTCLDQIRGAKDPAVRRRLLLENPDFDLCSFGVFHEEQDFVALTRFRRAEIEASIRQMQSLTPPDTPVPKVHFLEETGKDRLPFYMILRLASSELTDEVFRHVWARGEPILVTGAKAKFKLSWSPEYFIEHHGAENCALVDCETDSTGEMKVKEFFGTFGKYENRSGCWKLKDWPPSSDFASTFPALYTDFMEAVPVANHVRRDGIANIAAYFPGNGVAPDLGPKMYNAHGNINDAATASTRLHMDMADALNILMHAEPLPDGKPGGAAWDLFRAQDSDTIRQFLRAQFPERQVDDPIHGQEIFITDELRLKLWQTHGVKGYRVYQRVGEAVMIPAGCAHQVRNLSDCVKVAIDFVSVDNIKRCEKLTQEFRAVNNRGRPWKVDVLQLRSLLWFAWATCCRREDRQDGGFPGVE
ncbi:Clavaminate synthase-like protein [Mycena olivaceomarginata]|nr:Clavaminate synthase-like protein [Mycena olivaceomarginata]